MFEGIKPDRVLNMTDQEQRWFDNVKKAFHASDLAYQQGTLEDGGLQELFKAIDTAKTLRRSLRGEDNPKTRHKDNQKRFIEFLALEIPAAAPDEPARELRDAETGEHLKYTFGEIIYRVRCMVHENENLNAAEAVDHHILLNWSARDPKIIAEIRNGKYICNAYFLWNRLREVMAKFITGLESYITVAREGRFEITGDPELGSIRPVRRRRE